MTYDGTGSLEGSTGWLVLCGAASIWVKKKFGVKIFWVEIFLGEKFSGWKMFLGEIFFG